MNNDQPLSAQGNSRRRLLVGWFDRNKALPEREAATVILPAVARPPQALPEALFSALCNGCGGCVSSCPQ